MKNKSFVIIMIMSFFVLAVMLLSSTLFYVKNVTIDYGQEDSEITKIISSETDKNIFMVNKEKIRYIIQTKYPLINVDYIESVFPDKLVIHLSDRNELYSVESDEGYFICNESLCITKKEETFSSTKNNPIILSGIKNIHKVIGMEANKEKQSYIENLSFILLDWKTESELKSIISSIHIDYINTDNLFLSMYDGVNIIIEHSTEDMNIKLSYALSFYENMNEKYGTIKIIDMDNKTLLIHEK